jgi:hypothetical protein
MQLSPEQRYAALHREVWLSAVNRSVPIPSL